MADYYIVEGPHLICHGHAQDGTEESHAGPNQKVVVDDYGKILPRSLPPFSGARWNVQTLAWDDLRSVDQKANAALEVVQAQRYQAYPALEVLADALVHQAMGNHAPLDAYVQACIKVKKDFPKPNMG